MECHIGINQNLKEIMVQTNILIPGRDKQILYQTNQTYKVQHSFANDKDLNDKTTKRYET